MLKNMEVKRTMWRRYEIVLTTDENLTVLTAEIQRLAKIKKITEYNEKGEENVLYEEL